MWQAIVVGLIGGAVTGISPCILPVLPLVLAVSGGSRSRPYLVVAGLVTSFAATTLLGAAALSALGLPRDTLRWVGIALLVLVGIGMLVPSFYRVLEAPFEKLPRFGSLQQKARGKGGFVVGLAMGVVYVPCAGPVLAAITVAAASDRVDARLVAMTLGFAVGAAAPLLAFAVGGNRVGERVDFFHRHDRAIRVVAGVVVLAMAAAIATNAPERIQRALPDYTAGVQETLGEKVDAPSSSGSLKDCRKADPARLSDCGAVPALAEGTWLGGGPVDPRTAGVTLVDFWAYACINCQRANEHVTKLYDAYRDAGLTVVGVHSPEYAFEHETANVERAMAEQGIHYPVVQDNEFATWHNFDNRYWPAHYLVDAHGTVRQIHEGEGAYAETESLVRELLTQANPHVVLPDPVEDGVQAAAPSAPSRNPETYLGTKRAQYYAHSPHQYRDGGVTFDETTPVDGQYSLAGTWNLSGESITAVKDARVLLAAKAAWVQLVVSGQGTATLRRADGSERSFDVLSDGTIDLVKQDTQIDEVLTIEASRGLSLYSFTFG